MMAIKRYLLTLDYFENYSYSNTRDNFLKIFVSEKKFAANSLDMCGIR